MKLLHGKVSFKEMKETKRKTSNKFTLSIVHFLIIFSILLISPMDPRKVDAYNDVEAPVVRIIDSSNSDDDTDTDSNEDEDDTSLPDPERVEEEIYVEEEVESELVEESTTEEISVESEEETETDAPVEETAEVTEDVEVEEEPVAEELYRYNPTDEEYEILCRVVEAEVEGYDVWASKGLSHDQIIDAKVRVAQVFLNRLESKRFSETTLKATLMKKNASSTFRDGRYYSVKVTDYTVEAVNKALSAYTPDLTRGALFFSSGKPNSSQTIFKDEVGHIFGL